MAENQNNTENNQKISDAVRRMAERMNGQVVHWMVDDPDKNIKAMEHNLQVNIAAGKDPYWYLTCDSEKELDIEKDNENEQ